MFVNIAILVVLLFTEALCEVKEAKEGNNYRSLQMDPLISLPTTLTPIVHNKNVEIEKIWFINLDDHFTRRKFQEEQLVSLGIPFERKSAVRVQNLEECMRNATLMNIIHRIPSFFNQGLTWENISSVLPRKSKFVLSVFLSHLTLYEDILASQKRDNNTMNKIYLILEDDARLSPNFIQIFQSVYQEVPENWEILRLGFWGLSRESDRLGHYLFQASPPFWVPETDDIYYGGAHAICIQTKTLRSLIDKLEITKLADIDSMMTNFPHIRSYVFDQDLSIVNIEEFEENSNPSKEDRLLLDQVSMQQNLNVMQPSRKI